MAPSVILGGCRAVCHLGKWEIGNEFLLPKRRSARFTIGAFATSFWSRWGVHYRRAVAVGIVVGDYVPAMGNCQAS